MREDFKLSELTEKQKQKLIKFYNVSSLDDLEVEDTGNIRMKGSGKPVKVYLEDHDKKLHELSIPEFVKKQKNPPLGFVGLTQEEATRILEEFITKTFKKDLEVLVIEHGEKADAPTTLFQQLVIFYSNKLKSVLCGNKITEKYIHATGNPAYSDYDFYNTYLKEGKAVIKGFAFATLSKKELFIDVVCGTGGTGDMIRSIHENLSELRGKPRCISLESIETVQAISFYSHLGFKKKDKDTLKLLNLISKSKEKNFESFARKELPGVVAGLLYLDPPKSYKATWLYNPVSWWEAVQHGGKPKLEAGGVGSFFTSVADKLKQQPLLDRFKPKLGFTNQSKKVLGKYGNGKVVKLVVIRQPIQGVLDTILNTLSFGTFQKAKEKYGYDKLFHLQLAAYTKVGRGVTKIVLEKNETVDLSVSTEHVQTGDKEFLVVPFDKDFTLNDLVETARKQQGDQKFFYYDPFKNNCQWFISYLLHGQELYGPKEKAFLFQDLQEFNKDLPKWLPSFARKVTDLGATVANLRGKGRRAAPVGVEASKNDIKADLSKASNNSLDIIKKLSGGIGVQNYLTKEQREANRRAAEARVASLGPGVKAYNFSKRKADEERWADIRKYQDELVGEQAKIPRKKTLQDYQAETEYYKAIEKQRKEKEEKAEADKKAEEELQLKEKERLKQKRVEELREEYKKKQEQLKKDLAAYKEGRIDDIQNNEIRSRAQTERNLGFKGDNKKGLSYYQAVEETYKNALRQQKEQDMLMLIPTVLQMGINKIPKVGDAINDLIDATGVKEDTSEDARRKAIIMAGPPVRPSVVEGFEGDFPEPDFQDLAEKEGYGKSKNKSLETLHAVIINKKVPLEVAKKEAAKIIGNPRRKYFRETNKTYRFRNQSKQKFDPKSFRTQVVTPNLSLVFGNPKE
jgi:hypothetical protein